MKIRRLLAALGAETLAAGIFTLLFGAGRMPASALNGMFLAGFLFALTGTFIHAVNKDWFAYFHAAFPKANSAAPAEEVSNANRAEGEKKAPAPRAPIGGAREIALSGAIFIIAAFVLSLV